MPANRAKDDARVALVVDDDKFTATLLQTILSDAGYFVQVAFDAAGAIEGVEDLDPDVVLVDLDLGSGPSGIDVVCHIREISPWTAAVIVSGHRSPAMVYSDLDLPTDHVAYLVKSDMTSIDHLHLAIEAATANLSVNPPSGAVPKITRAQASLLRAIADGQSNLEIARSRDVGPKAVERMIARLYRSLALPTSESANPRVEATRMYLAGDVTTQ